MISLIICSRTQTISSILKENIKSTIGCEYELIVIDNSESKYSIFEAYNLGISKSKYPILLFLHEDVLFHTKNWGSILLSSFVNNPQAGLIGVAGSKIKTKMPSAWWENETKFLFLNIIQHSPDKETTKLDYGFKSSSFEEVVIIDGVFMAMRGNIGLNFNEKLKGFHNYDQSISIDVRKLGFQVFVTNKILIEHYSPGKIDKSWVKSTLIFHKFYKENLPQSLKNKVSKSQEAYSCLKFIYNCTNTGNKKSAFKFWLKYLVLKPFSKENKQLLMYFLSTNKILR